MWLNINSYSSYSAVNGNNGLIGHSSDLANGRISFTTTVSNVIDVWTTTGTHQITLTESMPISEWYNLTITRDASNNINVYKNGINVTNGSPTADGTLDFAILADNPTNSSWKGLDGKIDDVMIYEKALIEEECIIIYDISSRDKQMKIKTDTTYVCGELKEI
jgi:hypothetical protein